MFDVDEPELEPVVDKLFGYDAREGHDPVAYALIRIATDGATRKTFLVRGDSLPEVEAALCRLLDLNNSLSDRRRMMWEGV